MKAQQNYKMVTLCFKVYYFSVIVSPCSLVNLNLNGLLSKNKQVLKRFISKNTIFHLEKAKVYSQIAAGYFHPYFSNSN